MKRNLVVGDLHVQIGNLQETKILLSFIQDKFIESASHRLIFLGDIFHTHSVIRQEVAYVVLEFIKNFYYNVVGADRSRIVIIAGNHDGISPTTTNRNALSLVLSEFATVVSGSECLVEDEMVFIPYLHDGNVFIERALEGHKTAITRGWNDPILICHQTFDGAAFENGHPCPSGIKSELLPYSVIVAGHIHKRQVVKDKVLYLGTPRAVTASEYNDEKFIFLMSRNDDGQVAFTPISTSLIVKNYVVLTLNEGDQKDLDLGAYNLTKDDVRVKITGTQAFYDAVLEQYKQFHGRVKFIPNIKKDLSKKINLESSGVDINTALEKYVHEIADIDPDVKGDVWTTIVQMLH